MSTFSHEGDYSISLSWFLSLKTHFIFTQVHNFLRISDNSLSTLTLYGFPFSSACPLLKETYYASSCVSFKCSISLFVHKRKFIRLKPTATLTLLLKHLVGSPAFNSVIVWHHHATHLNNLCLVVGSAGQNWFNMCVNWPIRGENYEPENKHHHHVFPKNSVFGWKSFKHFHVLVQHLLLYLTFLEILMTVFNI